MILNKTYKILKGAHKYDIENKRTRDIGVVGNSKTN